MQVQWSKLPADLQFIQINRVCGWKKIYYPRQMYHVTLSLKSSLVFCLQINDFYLFYNANSFFFQFLLYLRREQKNHALCLREYLCPKRVDDENQVAVLAERLDSHVHSYLRLAEHKEQHWQLVVQATLPCTGFVPELAEVWFRITFLDIYNNSVTFIGCCYQNTPNC